MKLPIPRTGLVLLCGGLVLFISGLWSSFYGWVGASVEEKTTIFLSVLIVAILLLTLLRDLRIYLLQGYSFRVLGETLTINSLIKSNETLVIGPFTGLSGKALLLNLDFSLNKVKTEQIKPFHIYHPDISPEIYCEIRVLGHDGSNDVRIIQKIIEQGKIQSSESTEDESVEWGCVELPITENFSFYSLEIRVSIADNSQERLQPSLIRGTTRLDIAIPIHKLAHYSEAFIRTARIEIRK